MQPQRYPKGFCHVGLMGTLLSSAIEPWFAALVETLPPVLQDFLAFLVEFEATFRDKNR